MSTACQLHLRLCDSNAWLRRHNSTSDIAGTASHPLACVTHCVTPVACATHCDLHFLAERPYRRYTEVSHVCAERQSTKRTRRKCSARRATNKSNTIRKATQEVQCKRSTGQPECSPRQNSSARYTFSYLRLCHMCNTHAKRARCLCWCQISGLSRLRVDQRERAKA